MGQGDITVWTNWICEETETVMNQLEEERDARGDPDNPFNGTANGVFQPLQDNLVFTSTSADTQKKGKQQQT